MKRPLLIALLGFLVLAGYLRAEESSATVPDGRRTQLGLYLTSAAAYAKWQADPDNVKVLDVRTPEEYVFVGHPTMAWNVPLMLVTHTWAPGRTKLAMKMNPGFVQQVEKFFKPTDTLLVLCRSGARSTNAINALAEAGFTNAYNVLDGFEGDKDKDPDSKTFGEHVLNGWRNSECAWTYGLDADRIYLPGN